VRTLAIADLDADGALDVLTASFSRGVGGAVQGEATEVTLLRPDGTDVLLSPLRTPTITVLPPEGGVATRTTPFHRPVLTAANRDTLRRLARALRERLSSVPSIASEGPYDVELGFRDGHLWLFQVRPYVEAQSGRSDAYFRQLDAQAKPQPTVDLTTENGTITLRAIASARNAPTLWNLRCEIREQLVAYVREHYPDALPALRTRLDRPGDGEPPAFVTGDG
jgi:hypothetical protein